MTNTQIQNGVKGTWTTIDNNIFDDEENFKGWEKPVYMALLRYAYQIGGEARPSQQTIANKFGISRKTVNEVMKRLEEKGFLERLGTHAKTKTVIWRTRIPEEIDVMYKQKDLDKAKERLAKKGQKVDENYLPDEMQQPDPIKPPKQKAAKPDKPKNNDNDQIPFDEIIGYLNEKTGKAFRTAESHKTHIRARWNDGFRLEDFKKVVDIKTPKWIGEEKTNEWLRPRTLFGPKMEDYVNEAPTKQRAQRSQAHPSTTATMEEIKQMEEANRYMDIDGVKYDLWDDYENQMAMAALERRDERTRGIAQ